MAVCTEIPFTAGKISTSIGLVPRTTRFAGQHLNSLG